MPRPPADRALERARKLEEPGVVEPACDQHQADREPAGLGGRARFAGDPAERARKAVTMRIRAAISTIAAQDDTLARHLRNTIRTGRLCSYQPEEAVSWRT